MLISFLLLNTPLSRRYQILIFKKVILPLLETDLYEVMQACVKGQLDSIALKWKENTSAVGIVMASGGYPGVYEKGKEITGSLSQL